MTGEDATESVGDSLESESGLRDLILSLAPEGGLSIGNGAMLAQHASTRDGRVWGMHEARRFKKRSNRPLTPWREC